MQFNNAHDAMQYKAYYAVMTEIQWLSWTYHIEVITHFLFLGSSILRLENFARLQ